MTSIYCFFKQRETYLQKNHYDLGFSLLPNEADIRKIADGTRTAGANDGTGDYLTTKAKVNSLLTRARVLVNLPEKVVEPFAKELGDPKVWSPQMIFTSINSPQLRTITTSSGMTMERETPVLFVY